MAVSRDHWSCPDFYRREDWEGSEQLASRVYDYAHAGDFARPSRYTRAWGFFLALVVGASIITGAYLIGRIAVWIATGVA